MRLCDYLLQWITYINYYFKIVMNFISEILKYMIQLPIVSFIFAPNIFAKKISDDYSEPLDYEEFKSKTLNKASKCYLFWISPLIILSTFVFFTTIYYFTFDTLIILFMREYIKFLILIPIFFLLFLWIIPFSYFKLFFPYENKHAYIFIYGAIISLIFPLLVIPKYYHYFTAQSIQFTAKVEYVYIDRYKNKNNILKLSSQEPSLNIIRISRLDRKILKTLDVGDSVIIKGKVSKVYFNFENINKKEELKKVQI